MPNISETKRRTGNPHRKPWHLKGKGEYIAYLRDVDELTFDEIGFKVGCSGEGARQCYKRWKTTQDKEAA